MKAMIWKELKENSKWAVLAALGLGLAYAYMLSQVFGRDQHYNPYQAQGLPMPTTITAPLVGLLLGLLQILPELRRDQWAFLMHRPVPRTTLFWAKVIVGLSLYLLATLLPFLGAVLWMATPGRMAAPFDWRLTLAGTADILSGIVFYFAGVLTALRPARWYGSRALGIGAAVVCVFAAVTAHEFWHALLMIAVGAGVLLVAARGSFLTTGEYNGQPKLAKVALGTTLFAGSAVACCGAIAFVITMGSTLVAGSRAPYRWTRYEIDTAGRILLVTHEGSVLKSTVDLRGKPVKIDLAQGRSQYGHFLSKESLQTSGSRRYVPSYRVPTRYYMVLDNPYAGTDDAVWYYDRDQGLVLGYSRLDKRLMGYMTPDGFLPGGGRSTPKRTPRFPGEPLSTNIGYGNRRLLAFPDAVYRLDLNRKRITRIVSATPGQPIDGALEIGGGYENLEERPGVIAVATNNQIRIYSPQYKLLLTLPWEYKPKQHHYVELSLTPERDRLFVWYMPVQDASGQKRPFPGHTSGYITEVVLPKGSQKPALRRHNLPPLPEQNRRADDDWQPALTGLLIPPGLITGLIGYGAIGNALGNTGAERMWMDMTQRDPKMYILLSALSAFAAILSAALAWHIGRRCGFPARTRWAWVLGVLALGPFGLLMLLSLRGWPFRETCSACGQLRVVTNELCEHCGSRFPSPPRDGTEIFEAAT